jgi:hypothetical protein
MITVVADERIPDEKMAIYRASGPYEMVDFAPIGESMSENPIVLVMVSPRAYEELRSLFPESTMTVN